MEWVVDDAPEEGEISRLALYLVKKGIKYYVFSRKVVYDFHREFVCFLIFGGFPNDADIKWISSALNCAGLQWGDGGSCADCPG
jgi:hypothetical protein